MSEWTTLLTTRSNQPVLTQLRFDVRRYAWAEQGGPSVAEIAVDGDNLTSALDLIGCKVQVLAPDLTACWWGLVEEVAVSEGGSEYAVSLSDMANRISVIYSIASEGGAVTAQTAWAEDQRSIELYGRKELLHSMGTGTPDEAQRTLAQLLAQMSMPRLSVRPGRSGKAGAALHCVGYWQTLDWQYFAQGAGRIVHAGENEVEALLGWGFQSSQLVGFNSRDRRVHQLGALLGALSEGDRISVTGSTSNNGSFTVTEPAQVDKQVVYNSGSISFDPSDDMHDGNEWLDQFKAGEMLYVQDSTSNNGFWFVKGVAPDHITLHPETVVAESGGTATITQGNSVQVQEALTLEKPVPGSKFITVQAHGVKMAQSFVVPGADGAWTAGEVTVYLHRVGNPSDSVKVELCADNGSGGAGTVLDSALVAGSSLPTNSTAVTFGLARTAQLSGGLTYWLVISRTGAVSPTDYYQVGFDADDGYTGGSLYLYTGAAWEAKAASLNFEIWGGADTTALLSDIVSAAGGYLTGVNIRQTAGVYARRYRNGQTKALAEAQKLLSAGSSSGRLLATVGSDGVLIVDAAPVTPDLRWQDGRVVNRFGRDLQPGPLPVGQPVRFDTPQSSRFVSDGVLPINSAEYDAANDVMTPDFGEKSAYSVGGVGQG